MKLAGTLFKTLEKLQKNMGMPHQEMHLIYNQLVFSIQVANTIAIHAIILSTGTRNVVSFEEKR